jgi:hypothetical protein
MNRIRPTASDQLWKIVARTPRLGIPPTVSVEFAVTMLCKRPKSETLSRISPWAGFRWHGRDPLRDAGRNEHCFCAGPGTAAERRQHVAHDVSRGAVVWNESGTRGAATASIILCRRKNDALVELTLPEDANIFAAKYQFYLPSKQELKLELEKIQRELGDGETGS